MRIIIKFSFDAIHHLYQLIKKPNSLIKLYLRNIKHTRFKFVFYGFYELKLYNVENMVYCILEPYYRRNAFLLLFKCKLFCLETFSSFSVLINQFYEKRGAIIAVWFGCVLFLMLFSPVKYSVALNYATVFNLLYNTQIGIQNLENTFRYNRKLHIQGNMKISQKKTIMVFAILES